MKFQRTRFFASTTIVAIVAFTWTFLAAPVLTQARVVDPQGDSGIGAANGVAISSGVVAYISGKFVKYNDGVQAFGQVELEAVGKKIIQPSDTRTYVVDNNGKFYVIDTTNFNNPSILGTYQLPAGDCTDLDELDANTIIVMNDNKQMAKVDVTDPAAPTCATTDNMGTQFESAGGNACINDDGNICAVNMAVNPPVKGPLTNAAAQDISIDASGDHVYAGGGTQMAAYDLTGGVLAAPALLAVFVLTGFFAALVASATTNNVFAAFDDGYGNLIFALFLFTGLAFAQIALGFSIFKGSPRMAIDPTNPALLAVALVSGILIYEVVGSDLCSYASFIGASFISKLTFASILAIPYLFASAHYSGLQVWNMADPLVPLFLGFLSTIYAMWCFVLFGPGAAANSNVGATAAAGPYGIGAVSEFGFASYDLANPAQPALANNIFAFGVARDVAVSGDYAYGADDGIGLQIINTVIPTALSLVKTVPTPGPATRVAVQAGHAYVAAGNAGLQIIDVEPPASASIVNTIPSLVDINTITSDGTYLYVGDSNLMYIYDLTSPASPALLGSHTFAPEAIVVDIGIVDVPGPALAIASAASKLAYVAAGAQGFVIVDVSIPSTPSELATQPTVDFASAVAVNGTDVYLGDGAGGFLTYDVDPAQVPVLFQAFSVRASNRGVDLTWDFSADEAVLGLDIYRSIGGNALPVRLNRERLPASQRAFRDERVAAGQTYHYTVVAKAASGLEYSSQALTVEIPMRSMVLFPNHPNPFNPSTTISFDLPHNGHATLAIYDAAGRHVVTLVDHFLQAGINDVEWDGINARGARVGSGVYVAKLTAGGKTLTQKLTLLK